MLDVLIIGGGPAGLSTAIYAKRADLSVTVLDKGASECQITKAVEVENYLGYKSISGIDLHAQFVEHVKANDIQIIKKGVVSVEKTDCGFKVHTKKDEFECKKLVLAMGRSHKHLGVEGEEQFAGAGVSYCATCDGFFFKDKVVCVVGGGDSAVSQAIYLSAFCKKVYLIHRRDKLRAGAVLEGQLMKLPNVEIIWDSIPLEIAGGRAVETILLKNVKSEEEQELKVDGVFVAIGTQPSTALAKELVELDEQGYVIAGENGETSLAGFYVAGDIRTKQLRQIVTAVADGANAVTTAWNYVEHMK
jgi:thioredoxin reductase (NADPH)